MKSDYSSTTYYDIIVAYYASRYCTKQNPHGVIRKFKCISQYEIGAYTNDGVLLSKVARS